MACKFQINANLVRYVQEEGFVDYTELRESDVREISLDVEDQAYREISFGRPFDIFWLISEALRKRGLVR